MLQIETGIPLPTTGKKSDNPETNQLKSMEVGQSFMCDAKTYARLVPKIAKLRKTGEAHFITRAEGAGRRVWKIK